MRRLMHASNEFRRWRYDVSAFTTRAKAIAALCVSVQYAKANGREKPGTYSSL
jgi:hypothetical protein